MATSSHAGFRRYASPFPIKHKRVVGDGPVPSRVVLIGEKPGIDESRIGKPFVGPSGQILNTYLEVAGLNRKDIFVTNCVREFTDWSKPTRAELERDKPELVEEILACDPEVIGLVGAYAVEHILRSGRADMERRHGCPVHIDTLFGGELQRPQGWVVIPLLHPAGAIHSPDASPQILDDFLKLGRFMDGEIGLLEPDPFRGREDYRAVTADDLADILP